VAGRGTDRFKERPDRFDVSNVGRDCGCPAATGLHKLNGPGRNWSIDVRDKDVTASFVGQSERGRAADPPSRSCNDCDCSGDFHFRFLVLFGYLRRGRLDATVCVELLSTRDVGTSRDSPLPRRAARPLRPELTGYRQRTMTTIVPGGQGEDSSLPRGV